MTIGDDLNKNLKLLRTIKKQELASVKDTSGVLFLCKFGGDAAVFSLNNGSSFNELCEVIRSNFSELSTADFTVKYVFPGSEPCALGWCPGPDPNAGGHNNWYQSLMMNSRTCEAIPVSGLDDVRKNSIKSKMISRYKKYPEVRKYQNKKLVGNGLSEDKGKGLSADNSLITHVTVFSIPEDPTVGSS
ncbi:hypothetical protein LguiA_012047 [Lonicera macranthoides]